VYDANFYAGANLTKLIQEKYYKEPYEKDKIGEIVRDFSSEKLDIDKEIRDIFTKFSLYEIENVAYKNSKIEPDEILEIAENFKNSEIIKILEQGILQVDKLSDAIFSIKESYDIFLSHSHSDITEILKIKEDIENKTDRKVFVDSVEWESMYEIEKFMRYEIKKYIYGLDQNKKLCPNFDSLKLYKGNINKLVYINLVNALERRVYSTFDVVLAISLKKVMSKYDFFVFVPTSNSCNISVNKTLSSWIYYENQISASYFTKKEWYDKYKHGGVSLDDVFNNAKSGDFPLFEFPMNYSKLDKLVNEHELVEYIR
jgi:hypothetical protein